MAMPRKFDQEDKPPLQFRDSFLLPLAIGFTFLLKWLASNKFEGDIAMALSAVGNVSGFIAFVMLVSIVMDKSKGKKKRTDI
jgi:hypothetical protein